MHTPFRYIKVKIKGHYIITEARVFLIVLRGQQSSAIQLELKAENTKRQIWTSDVTRDWLKEGSNSDPLDV